MNACIVLLLEIGILAQSNPTSAAGAASAQLTGSITIPREPSAPGANQGCVNQGSDRREFAPVVCWLQRHLSWKSKHKPHFALIGKSNATNLGLHGLPMRSSICPRVTATGACSASAFATTVPGVVTFSQPSPRRRWRTRFVID